ncbi:MAG: hypothetical protein ABDH91_08265 [Bacteroidia bacterium]
MRLIDALWERIFNYYRIGEHDFDAQPFFITAAEIKKATRRFSETSQREIRILCKQDTREERPKVFRGNNLFILPIRNGEYAILKGEGYVDIPPSPPPQRYRSKLDFELETSRIGNSEMQHLDYAYAISILRGFLKDSTLFLAIRGRKYIPEFEFYFGAYKEPIHVRSVQTEVDAGYEGRDRVILVEAKNRALSNIIIRQLYYPFRQWTKHTKKKVEVVLFEKSSDEYRLWLFEFTEPKRYNSIKLKHSAAYCLEAKSDTL